MRNFVADSIEQGNSHEFGEFRFDADKHVLYRNGELVSLPPKSIDLLAVLLERRGDIFERGELIDRVWKDTFVEEGNLNYTISRLRKALGSTSNGEEFIQTIPRRGYRFVDEASTNGDVIYEKHSLTETVIEEIHTSDPNRAVSTEKARNVLTPLRAAAVLVFVIGITAAIATTWRFMRTDAPPLAAVKSIAVLPFRTVGEAGGHDGLGLADILITRLSSVRNLIVRPTGAVGKFEGSDVDARETGKQLGVDALLQGMIHRTDGRVRITARLTRSSDGVSLWSGVFDRPAAEESALENDIVIQLVNALALNADLAGSGHASPYTTNLEAYQLYVRGRFEWNKRNTEGILESQRLFRNAIAADPNFALAYVGLADSLVFDAETPEMGDALMKALSLDPNLGEAYATFGFVDTVHRWKWDEAEANFRRAVELRPGYATGHHWYATLLGIQGRNDEAKAEMMKALEINPESYNFIADLGEVYYFERDYVKAKEHYVRAIEIYPDFPFAHQHLERIYWLEGDYEKALDEMVNAMTIGMHSPTETEEVKAYRAATRESYRKPFQAGGGGLKELIESYLKYHEQSSTAARNPNTPFHTAWFYALAGEKEKALDNLEKAYDQRAFLLAWVKADPVFDGLRDEPRYLEILRKMGLS